MENQQATQQGAGILDRASVDSMLETLRTTWSQTISEAESVVPHFNIGFDEFCDLLTGFGSVLMASKRLRDKFVIDSDNRNAIEQLYFYTTSDQRFSGALHKGIALIGHYGRGKSLLLEAYCDMINAICEYRSLNRCTRYTFITASEIALRFNESYFDRLVVGGIAIDELGREARSVKHYGTELMPVIDLLFERYRRGTITHITANYSLEDLSAEDMYGEMLGDRLREMFNFIVMDGKSRRK